MRAGQNVFRASSHLCEVRTITTAAAAECGGSRGEADRLPAQLVLMNWDSPAGGQFDGQ